MDDLYREVQSLIYKVNDALDERAHHLAQSLVKEVQRLEDYFQTGKNTQTLRDQTKKIVEILRQIRPTNVMSSHDINRFHKIFEEIEQKLRRL